MKHSTLYTRTGDSGLTSLVSGNRISKTSPRIEAYGTIDELNSHIGLIAAQSLPEPAESSAMLTFIQHKLFDLGAYLACDPDFLPQGRTMPPGVDDADIERIEAMIDSVDARLPRLNRFVLPGGTQASAMTQVARTVCRRAERRALSLAAEVEVDAHVLKFLNRLSDFLFAFSRYCNIAAGREEIFWEQNI